MHGLTRITGKKQRRLPWHAVAQEANVAKCPAERARVFIRGYNMNNSLRLESCAGTAGIVRTGKLLDGFPEAERQLLLAQCKPVDLRVGEVLYQPDQPQPYAYFPIDCIISILYITEDGHSAEMALVGNEGLLGICSVLGGMTTPSWAIVQNPGRALRLRTPVLVDVFNSSACIRLHLLRYIQALMTQMSQTAACNRHHSIQQRLCRWLLLSMDRLDSAEIRMTQEMISNVLGVRREGVTEAAGRLQRAGLIANRRGRITILDRGALESICCECYEVVCNEFDRLVLRPENRCRRIAS